MKNSEIKALSLEELQEKVIQEQENLQRLKFAHATNPIENPMKIRVNRKLIAKIQTELTARTPKIATKVK